MISHFFIDRPIFATVLSVVIVIVGVVAVTQLPVAQYPDVAPPTVQVTATYPGANAKTTADNVATPIEQEVNGVERMLYMSSKCTNDGQMNLDVTFELGTNLDTAQVLVQNRVAVAEAKLPEEVKRIGVTTKKKSPSILLCVNLVSAKRPDGSFFYDQLYLSNFATLSVKDDLARIKGVGDVAFLGPRDYSMRVWLDPDKLAARDLTASDVINAVREQNRQVAAGRLGQPPVPTGDSVQFQLPINTAGRLTSEEQFENIVLKTSDDGGVVHFKDVVRETHRDADGRTIGKGIELGAKNYDVNSYLDGEPCATLAVFQLPGSNALDTAAAIRAKMEELKAALSGGRRLPHLLRHDGVRRRVDPQRHSHADRSLHSGLYRRARVSCRTGGPRLFRWLPCRFRSSARSPSWRFWAFRSITCRCLDWCWRSASWSMMPSSSWKTSSAGWRRECRRAMPAARRWKKSPGR